MTARRNFLKAATLSGAALAVPFVASAAAPSLPRGMLCVVAYGKPRRAHPAGLSTSVIAVSIPDFSVNEVPSPVKNLHGILRAGPGRRQLWAVGHESDEYMDVFDENLNRIETRQYPGFRFRGHGLPWRDGFLIAAERMADPMEGGLLLYLDETGKLLEQYPTGGLRPHEVVVCGDYLAVAHYGNRPRPTARGPMTQGLPTGFGAIPQYSVRGTPTSEAPPAMPPGFSPNGGVPFSTGTRQLHFDVVKAGVSFLRLADLSLQAFYPIAGEAAISHLGATVDGSVMAMGLNTLRLSTQEALYEQAALDDARLLPSEGTDRGYEIYVPMYRVHPTRGVVETLKPAASHMRRGQSFAHDAATGLVIATYAASQTLYVQQPGKPDRWLNTLDFGVPDPRGCAVLPGGRFVAVSGNNDNIAIIDLEENRLEKLVGVPLAGHSHMFWI